MKPQSPLSATPRTALLIALLFLSLAARSAPGDERTDAWRELGVATDVAAAYDAAQAHLAAKEFALAEERARTLLARVEAEYGEESLEAALALDCLVEALNSQGRSSEDETLAQAERAVRLKLETLGRDHERTTWSMTLLSYVLRQRGEFERALDWQKQALEVHERIDGPRHATVGKICDGIGATLRLLGDPRSGKEWHQRSLDVLSTLEGRSDLEVAVVQNNLAICHEMLAEFDEARELHEKTLELRRRFLPADHVDIAQSHTNLGIAEAMSGRIRESLPHFEEALRINSVAYGEVHPEVAASWNNVSLVHSSLGDYLRARRDLENSLRIRREVFGPDHWQTAQSQFNLGALLSDLGDTEEAANVLREALRVQSEQLPEGHPNSALTMAALGRVLAQRGQARAALPMFEQAGDIFGATVGPEHPDAAAVLLHTGRAHLTLDDPALAETFLTAAVAAYEKAYAGPHTSLAEARSELGVALRRSGRPAPALAAHEAALATLTELLGISHPLVGRELRRRAESLLPLGRAAEAFADAQRAEEIFREFTGTIVRGISERRAMRWLDGSSRGLPLMVRLAADHPERPEWAAATWRATVAARALVLTEMSERQRRLRTLSEREAEGLATDLRDARQRFANLVLRGPADDPVERWTALVDAARRDKEDAERRVAERVADAASGARVSADDVRAQLPAGSVLVSYVRGGAGVREEYAAFVVREDRVDLVPLSAVATTRGAIEAWQAVAGAPNARGIRRGTRPSESAAAARETGAEVRRLVWDPIQPAVADAELVFVVPDGALHFVAWDALPLEDGRWLAEAAPPIHLLSAEREICRAPAPASGAGLLTVGGAEFDRLDELAAPASSRGERIDCDAVGSLRFAALPGSAAEAKDIAEVWAEKRGERVEALTGAGATETAVKQRAPGKRGLHLATHGFLLAEGCGSPLMQAGLALAGANRSSGAEDRADDGILTAEEIASLELDGVEWVVLSACNSGGGGVQAGEGVLGLRRSFETAGVGTLVTSLWDVDDTVTAAWMRQLYIARFRHGASVPSAVRRANLELLAAIRATGREEHPSRWAGFVASGRWR